MTWHTGPLALFDLESTGVDPHRDRIVTAAVVEVTPGRPKPVPRLDVAARPRYRDPGRRAAVHGITTEQRTLRGVGGRGDRTRLLSTWWRSRATGCR
jgi:DNA polymerase-3 subunit epsilon